MAIYLKANDIKGDVGSKVYEKWVELDSLNFGLVSQVHTQTGNTHDRIKSKPVIGEVEVTKTADSSSIAWFQHALKRTVIPEVTIDLVQTGNNLTTYAQYIIKNVIVSEYQEAHQGGDGSLQELLRLNFTHIEKTFKPRDSAGKVLSPLRADYNLVTGEA